MNTEQFNGHTPGPWDVIHDSRNDVVISHGGEETVCRLPHYPLFSNAQFKNAHLIAAAPDLLDEVERLQQMVRELFDKVDDDFAFSWAVKNIGEQDMPWFRGEEE